MRVLVAEPIDRTRLTLPGPERHTRTLPGLLCAAPSVLGLRRQTRRTVLLLVITMTIVPSVGCRREAGPADDVTVVWRAAATPRVGDATTADVTLRDAAHQPVRGAHLQVQAFMSHPGMAPVIVAAEEHGDGVYRARLRFTMTGPWTVLVRGWLADGRTVTHRVDIPDVRADAQ